MWEGFDEPFHYAYVESLSTNAAFPVFGRSPVSREIAESFRDVPLTRMLSVTVPGALSFEEWFRIGASEKTERLARLSTLSSSARAEPSDILNYEAQQAPLAYMVLAPFDAALARVPLRYRILLLRLIATVSGTLLLWFGVVKLCRLLQISDTFAFATAAGVFSAQMLWATIAHVGNDYLAVPLTFLLLVWLGIAAQKPSVRNLVILSVIFSAGLLTKAYFLAFTPVFVWCVLKCTRPIVLLIPAITALPWYVHNRFLYGSFSGTQQSVAGIGFTQAIFALPHIPLVSSSLAFLHWSLWTGNWSFLSFSKATLNIELGLIGMALALYFRHFRHFTKAEWWGLAACGCFCAALLYQTCVTYIHTHGLSLFAEPWYWQGIVCFIWVLAFRGLEQSVLLGRIIALVLVLLSAWICAVTYVAKLFPMYGDGFDRATIRHVWAWWSAHPTQDLSTVALAPPGALYVLLGLLLLILAVQTALIAACFVTKTYVTPGRQ